MGALGNLLAQQPHEKRMCARHGQDADCGEGGKVFRALLRPLVQ